MNRGTAIICGVLLFGLGLFLGMVGSFVRTLPLENPPSPKSQARAVPAVSPPKRAAQAKPPAVKPTPPDVESALSQALAMVAVALSEQPAAHDSTPAVSAETVTNAPEQHPLDLLMQDTAAVVAQTEPPVAEPPQSPTPPSPEPMAGHWVFDRQLGWMWLQENTSSVVIVPVIEVFPGGLITIHSGSRSAAARTTRKAVPPQSSQPRKGSVIQHDEPGSARKPATSLIPNKN
jgi:hypothetical protein